MTVLFHRILSQIVATFCEYFTNDSDDFNHFLHAAFFQDENKLYGILFLSENCEWVREETWMRVYIVTMHFFTCLWKKCDYLNYNVAMIVEDYKKQKEDCKGLPTVVTSIPNLVRGMAYNSIHFLCIYCMLVNIF